MDSRIPCLSAMPLGGVVCSSTEGPEALALPLETDILGIIRVGR